MVALFLCMPNDQEIIVPTPRVPARTLIVPTLRVPAGKLMIVPPLRVGMQPLTLRVKPAPERIPPHT
jgi:hypothetical protein